MIVSIGDGANDGEPGEHDLVAADVERVQGGHGDDTLIGDDDANWLYGSYGNDSLLGGGGPDILYGDFGDDRIDSADTARDDVRCGAGTDAVVADLADAVASTCEHLGRSAG